MESIRKTLCLAVALILILATTAMANEKEASNIRPESDLTAKAVVGGSNELTGGDVPFFGPSRFGPNPQPPGDTAGLTYYDMQHNGTMGRQIVLAPNLGEQFHVHFVWMWKSSPTEIRKIRYNMYNRIIDEWPHGHGSDPDAGKVVSGNNGGYCTIDINSTGAAIAAWHEGLAGVYNTYVGRDTIPPSGKFSKLKQPGPPNCEGYVSSDGFELGSEYIWPIVEFDLVGGDSIYHIMSTENPGPGAPPATIQSYIYYRLTNEVLDACPPGSHYEDSILGRYIDEAHNITPTVRSDPNSDKVAIVYLKELYADGDLNNDCPDYAVQWKHDVVYIESTDGGVTFGSLVNVTDYTQSGTLVMSEIKYSAYTDLTALYDSDSNLHIVWNTPVWQADGTCEQRYASMLWHWDDNQQMITPVYDATFPALFYSSTDPDCPNTGTWNIIASKPNISECDGNLYVSFTRFGGHPDTTEGYVNDSVGGDFSDDNLLNGDIYLTASSDGGITWGPDGAAPAYTFPGTSGTGTAVKKGTAVNITNTYTQGCEAGDCHSEHWATMAKYSTDSVHIAYIDDNDAGDAVNDCGEWTNNAFMYTGYPCFEPEGTFGYKVEPTDVVVEIAPNGVPNCNVPYSDDFTLTISNTGNVPIDYVNVAAPAWLTPAATNGTITAGVNPSVDLVYTVGPIDPPEGDYLGTITISLTSSAGGDVAVINVTAHVECYVPEYEILSTACWSVGVWNVPRSGIAERGDEGNMCWFIDEIAPMYDNGVIIAYASNLDSTYFSIYDGSNSEADFIAVGPLVVEKDEYPDYEYAHGQWATPDSVIVGFIEYFTPKHPDSCFLIERFTITNDGDVPITIHVGEGIDWDFPDGEDPPGSDNSSGVNIARQMVWQSGPIGVSPEENYCGGVAFTRSIPGAIVLENDVWVHTNSGYFPDSIGMLLDTLTDGTFTATDSVEDLNSVYVVDQNLTLDPGECKAYCKVKASSLDGLGNEDGSDNGTLYNLIDKGNIWATDRYLDEAACYPEPTGFDPDLTIMKHNTVPPSVDNWVGTGWHELFPNYCEHTTVIEAQDNGTAGLNYCDHLKFRQINPPYYEWWEHVYWVTWTLMLVPQGGGDLIFFDLFRGWTNQQAGQTPVAPDAITHPWRSYWVKTDSTGLGSIIEIVAWDDNGNGYLDYCDFIVVMNYQLWPWCAIPETYHVNGLSVDIWTVRECPSCVIGDANESGAVDIDDVVYLIIYIFAGGPEPTPMCCCGDADGSGAVDIDDVVYLIQYIFAGGPAPDPEACNPPWK